MALPAKLNLFLYITGRREDGYHLLQTLFQFLDYGDTLTIDPRQDDRINLLTPVDGVPDEQNLIVRAARLLQRYCDERGLQTAARGADISIDKRLPMGGGLGGGSSNAATVLVALNELWRCGLGDDQLAELYQPRRRRAGVRARPRRFRRRHRRAPAAGRAAGKMVSGGPSRRRHPDAGYLRRRRIEKGYPGSLLK